MLRWAGRASLVIMNQEENNTDTGSEDIYNVNVLDTALGGAKLLYKFTLLAKATDINLVNDTPNQMIAQVRIIFPPTHYYLVGALKG